MAIGMAFLQSFVSCTDEKFDIIEIVENEISTAKQASEGWKCDASFSNILRSRKPTLDAQAEKIMDPQMAGAVLEKFQISIHPDGSVTDK